MTEKSGHSSTSLSSGFQKILLRSDVERPRQAENGSVEQCQTLHVKTNELFSLTGLATVLYELTITVSTEAD